MPVRPAIGRRQLQVLQYMASCANPPSLSEIMQQVGWRSTTPVSEALRALQRNGYIRTKSCRPRARWLTPLGRRILEACQN